MSLHQMTQRSAAEEMEPEMLEVLIEVHAANGTTVTHTGPMFETRAEAVAWVSRLWRGTPHTIRIVRVA